MLLSTTLALARYNITGGNWPGHGCKFVDCQIHVTPFYPDGYVEQAQDDQKVLRQNVVKVYGRDASKVCCCCVPFTLIDPDCRYLVQVGHKYWVDAFWQSAKGKLRSVPKRGLRYFFHPHWSGKEKQLFERVPDDSKYMSKSGGHINEAKACFDAYLRVKTLADIDDIRKGRVPDPYMFLHYASSKRFANPTAKRFADPNRRLNSIKVVDFPGTPCRCSTCKARKAR